MKARKDINADSPDALLDYELAQEKAAALGRHGRALEAALARLRQHDEAGAAAGPHDRRRRTVLVAAAGEALWNLIVQREACGLRDANQVMRDYAVPAEVQGRMGVLPEASARRLRGTG